MFMRTSSASPTYPQLSNRWEHLQDDDPSLEEVYQIRISSTALPAMILSRLVLMNIKPISKMQFKCKSALLIRTSVWTCLNCASSALEQEALHQRIPRKKSTTVQNKVAFPLVVIQCAWACGWRWCSCIRHLGMQNALFFVPSFAIWASNQQLWRRWLHDRFRCWPGASCLSERALSGKLQPFPRMRFKKFTLLLHCLLRIASNNFFRIHQTIQKERVQSLQTTHTSLAAQWGLQALALPCRKFYLFRLVPQELTHFKNHHSLDFFNLLFSEATAWASRSAVSVVLAQVLVPRVLGQVAQAQGRAARELGRAAQALGQAAQAAPAE